MMNRTLTTTIAAVILIGTAGTYAQKNKPGGGSNTLTPVTAQFRCPMTADCAGDAIEGDTLGEYRGTLPNGGTTTPEGLSENLGAYLTDAQLFVFVLKSGRGRFVSFDFTQAIGNAPCVGQRNCRRTFSRATTDESLPGSRTYPVDAMGSDLPNGFASIPVGGSAPARFFLNFSDPDGRALLWTVRFDPTLYPGSSFVTVSRPGVNNWTIEATDAHTAQLVSATTSGKNVKVNEGYYRMPFKISVTK